MKKACGRCLILLEGEGYDVTLAAGGIDGISLLNKDIFDMVITDINMPKVNGFEILKKCVRLLLTLLSL